jgi:hypothetical protein
MGYYAPSFGGLDQGWYFKTTDQRYAEERQRCLEWWNAECDAGVEDYLRRYGMFLSAFENSIKDDIRTRLGENFKFPDYFAYFIVSRVLETPHLAKLYREDYESRSGRTIICTVCNNCQSYDDIHPSLIGRTWRILPLCNTCWFWIAELTPLQSLAYVSEDFKERVRRLSSQQTCQYVVESSPGSAKRFAIPLRFRFFQQGISKSARAALRKRSLGTLGRWNPQAT